MLSTMCWIVLTGLGTLASELLLAWQIYFNTVVEILANKTASFMFVKLCQLVFSLGIKAFCLNHRLIPRVMKRKYYSKLKDFI